jgi:hypothetical protein
LVHFSDSQDVSEDLKETRMSKVLTATVAGVAALGIALSGCGESDSYKEVDRYYEEGTGVGGLSGKNQRLLEKTFE